MGSEGKSRKRRSSASPPPPPPPSSSRDEGEEKGRNHRKRDDKERKSRKDDDVERNEKKKERRRSEKLHKRSKSQEGKEEEEVKKRRKSSRKDMESDFTELSKDDYFSKNNEFSTWLKEERGQYFSDLSSENAREMFSSFIKRWNSGKLESRYYQGIVSAPRTAHNWKIKGEK